MCLILSLIHILTTGMFADRDEMGNCKDEFDRFYPGRAHSYPGTHLPNYPEIKQYIIPVIHHEIPDPIIKLLMPLVYNKRNYVMAKTLTEHDQSSYSTISR